VPHVSLSLLPDFDRGNEAITPAMHRFDVPLCLAAVTKGFTGLRHTVGERIIGHERLVRPELLA
jgi:hypothetical protein